MYIRIPFHTQKKGKHGGIDLLCVCICMFVYMFARISMKKDNKYIYLYTSVLFDMSKSMARHSDMCLLSQTLRR